MSKLRSNRFILFCLVSTLALGACVTRPLSAPSLPTPSPDAADSKTTSTADSAGQPSATPLAKAGTPAPAPSASVVAPQIVVVSSTPGGLGRGQTPEAPQGATPIPPTATPTSPPPPPTSPPAPTPVPPTATPPPSPCAVVNWTNFLSNDPTLTHPQVPSSPGLENLPYVEYKSTTAKSSVVGGYPLIENIVCGDIGNDGSYEAVISLASGGTAGVTGILIYRITPNGPVFVTAAGGYKIFAEIKNGQLYLTEPVYSTFDPNCCPSGRVESRWTLNGKLLVKVGEKTEGIAEARVPTVEMFYLNLGAKRYRDAYAFFSAAYKRTHPYSTWVAGYANTLSITATVSQNADGSVKVDLATTEKSGTTTVNRKYSGKWTLAWGGTTFRQWLLDTGSVQRVP